MNVNLNFILKMSLTTNGPLFGVSFRDFFLANLAKGKMSICHHFSSVVRYLFTSGEPLV